MENGGFTGFVVENWGFSGKWGFFGIYGRKSGVLVENGGFFRKMGFSWVFGQQIREK